MRTRSGRMHAIFTCQDCGVTFEDFKDAKEKGRAHAINKNHRVEGEIGIFYEYDARPHHDAGGPDA